MGKGGFGLPFSIPPLNWRDGQVAMPSAWLPGAGRRAAAHGDRSQSSEGASSGNRCGPAALDPARRISMATEPPQPSQPGQPVQPPPEIIPPAPDVDVPAPSPASPPGPSAPPPPPD